MKIPYFELTQLLFSLALAIQWIEHALTLKQWEAAFPSRRGQDKWYLICFGIAIASSLFWPGPLVQLICLGFILFYANKWNGTFNGGSDMMSLIIGSGLFISSLDAIWPPLRQLGITYIGVHATFSYFIAGAIKLQTPDWRGGSGLPAFINSSLYSNQNLSALLSKKSVSLGLSWLVMLFEITLPLALLNGQILAYYFAGAMAFHITNALIFGLNRFIWVWAAAWPGIFFISETLASSLH